MNESACCKIVNTICCTLVHYDVAHISVDNIKSNYTDRIGQPIRIAGAFATSFDRAQADIFVQLAVDAQRPGVLFLVSLDPRGETSLHYRCKHVSLLTDGMVSSEKEFLFTPYSIFTVKNVTMNVGSLQNPHVIEMIADIENHIGKAENQPLALWY